MHDPPPYWCNASQVERPVLPLADWYLQCDGSGNKHCVETCRQQLDYVVPPIKPGGLSTVELARYLQDHPKVSPVSAMRKAAATPEEAMHFWALCANGVEDAL